MKTIKEATVPDHPSCKWWVGIPIHCRNCGKDIVLEEDDILLKPRVTIQYNREDNAKYGFPKTVEVVCDCNVINVANITWKGLEPK